MRTASTLLPAVFDTSPLIFLDVLGYVSLLIRLYDAYVTPKVIEELQAKPGRLGSEVPKLGILKSYSPNPDTLQLIQAELSAGPGEVAFLAVALELGAWVVLDDKTARTYAKKDFRLVGTLGVLLRIHELGLAQRSLQDDVEALQDAGMRLSEEIKQGVLETFSNE